MSSRRVPHRSPLAIDDIAEHSQHIAENNLDAALRLLDAVEATVELLSHFPEAGGAVPTNRNDVDGLRAKLVDGFGNYVVLYFVTEKTVDIAWGRESGADRSFRTGRGPPVTGPDAGDTTS